MFNTTLAVEGEREIKGKKYININIQYETILKLLKITISVFFETNKAFTLFNTTLAVEGEREINKKKYININIQYFMARSIIGQFS